MELKVLFRDHCSGELVVKNKRTVIDRFPFEFDRNLEEALIVSIDKILERNTMDVLSLKSMKVGGNIGSESLSYQIATSFIKALKS